MPEIIPDRLSPRAQDITGQRFHRLVAIRYIGYQMFKKVKMLVWEFRCDCGRVKALRKNAVNSGGRQSCGCILEERKKNKIPQKILNRRAYLKHREQRLKDAAVYRSKNKHRIKAYQRANLEAYRIRESAKRARMRSDGGESIAILNWVRRIKRDKHVRCYYCRGPIKSLEIDHIIPLSKNGFHRIDNLAASCMHCNKTKSAILLKDWSPTPQRLLSL